MNIISTML